MKFDINRRAKFLVFIASLIALYIFLAGQVSKVITKEDQLSIERLGLGNQCEEKPDFDAEVLCVRAIQAAIKVLVPDTTCPPLGSIIEPSEFLRRKQGCCYDRARFTEKALIYYGFQTRHVALYDSEKYGGWSLLFPGVRSHATSEVNTVKGWMGVDSNFPFILITQGKLPLTYRNYQLHDDELVDKLMPLDFYRKKLLVVYGLYSRHGRFHGPDLPAPEFEVNELIFNFNS
jgi:hypothetical protein